jgi:N-methylhydantoinase B
MDDQVRIAVDPVTTSVVQGALESIAVEIGYKLMRMSYSSIIRESEDFGGRLRTSGVEGWRSRRSPRR